MSATGVGGTNESEATRQPRDYLATATVVEHECLDALGCASYNGDFGNCGRRCTYLDRPPTDYRCEFTGQSCDLFTMNWLIEGVVSKLLKYHERAHFRVPLLFLSRSQVP